MHDHHHVLILQLRLDEALRSLPQALRHEEEALCARFDARRWRDLEARPALLRRMMLNGRTARNG